MALRAVFSRLIPSTTSVAGSTPRNVRGDRTGHPYILSSLCLGGPPACFVKFFRDQELGYKQCCLARIVQILPVGRQNDALLP